MAGWIGVNPDRRQGLGWVAEQGQIQVGDSRQELGWIAGQGQIQVGDSRQGLGQVVGQGQIQVGGSRQGLGWVVRQKQIQLGNSRQKWGWIAGQRWKGSRQELGWLAGQGQIQVESRNWDRQLDKGRSRQELSGQLNIGILCNQNQSCREKKQESACYYEKGNKLLLKEI